MSVAGDGGIDLREELVRIDRAIAETRKFVAEHDKLAAEARDCERWLAPLVALNAVIAAAVGAAASSFLHH